MKRQDKQREVTVLREKLAKAKQIIVADHTGINVADLTVLRRKLKEAQGEFRVSKNTLLRLAVKDTDLNRLEEYFTGPTAIVFGYDDPTVTAKVIHDSIKETEKPRFKAYYLDGEIHGFETLVKMASIPPREVVLATLVGCVGGPIVQFLLTLEAATTEVVSTLEALISKKREE